MQCIKKLMCTDFNVMMCVVLKYKTCKYLICFIIKQLIEQDWDAVFDVKRLMHNWKKKNVN